MNKFFSKNIFLVFVFFLLSNISFVKADEIIKILAIGNSFSQDAVESYLDDLALSANVRLVVGNLRIGGCSLETHWINASEDKADYTYRKISEGLSTTLSNQTLLDVIKDENWDYITFQQVSNNSGIYSTYFPYLTHLIEYVRNNATNPNVKFAMHQTWAYETTSTHSGFINYDKNQLKMYQAIVDTVNTVASQVGIDIIIPSGTAIQNGRTSYIGDNFCRDGYHLSLDLGRYTASCTWFEKLIGQSVVGNTFAPANLSKLDISIAQYAAHFAVQNPNSVTSMSDFMPKQPKELETDIYIDFGPLESSKPWNNMTSYSLESKINDLEDANGNETVISITVNDAFCGSNSSGMTTTSTPLAMSESISKDSFYGNGTGVFNGKSEPTAGFLLSGFVPNQQLDLHFFGSRSNSSDNRETYYTVTGETTQTVLLNTANYTANIVSVMNMRPKEDGTITLSMGAGSNNTNENKFYYINALKISPRTSTNTDKVTIPNIRLYPNPVNGTVSVQSDYKINTIEIIDLSGRRILYFNDINSTNNTLDLSKLNNGYYFLKHDKGSLPFTKTNK
jgi:hypothetical protein